MSWNHEWCTAWRVAFVTRTLDDDEQQAYGAHLPHCPDCTVAVGAMVDDVALLALGAPPRRPGPQLEPAVAAARIVAAARAAAGAVPPLPPVTSAPDGPAAHEENGALEIVRDRAGRSWGARVRQPAGAGPGPRYVLSYVCADLEVRRRELPADGALVALVVPEGESAILGATLTVEPTDRPAASPVVGHVVIGGG